MAEIDQPTNHLTDKRVHCEVKVAHPLWANINKCSFRRFIHSEDNVRDSAISLAYKRFGS